MSSTIKLIKFLGSSRNDLQDFPDDARQAAGRQLLRVQYGREPTDWKPMPAIGAGVNEIRIRDEGDQYRVIYVAKFEDAVFVLHCFPKKTQKTAKADIELAKTRYRALVKALKK